MGIGLKAKSKTHPCFTYNIHLRHKKLYTIVLVILNIKSHNVMWNFPIVASHQCSKASSFVAVWGRLFQVASGNSKCTWSCGGSRILPGPGQPAPHALVVEGPEAFLPHAVLFSSAPGSLQVQLSFLGLPSLPAPLLDHTPRSLRPGSPFPRGCLESRDQSPPS